MSLDSTVKVGPKKICQANQQYIQMVFWIKVKQNEYLVSIDKVDFKDMFESTIMKCKKIVVTINKDNHSIHTRNDPKCKDKWGTIYGDFI